MAEVATLSMSQLPNGALNGTAEQPEAMKVDSVPAKFASNGVILPPPEIKSVIDRSALAISRSANPVVFEEKLRENQRNDPKFSFLNPADPYHAYYRDRLDRIQAGEIDTDAAMPEASKEQADAADASATIPEEILEPPPNEFVFDVPNISPLDIDIIKLTALFTARRGRGFLTALSAREGRNFQFEFLRPSHSLFSYFNHLVEQYTKVLHPTAAALALVSERTTPKGKRQFLSKIQSYSASEKIRRERKKKRDEDKAIEQKAFNEIDWHDYAIVQTIEFTPADGDAELPVPMTRAEVESMTLAQKRMAAMIMEDAEEDIAAHNARQAAAEVEALGAMPLNGVNGRREIAGEDDEFRAMRLKEEEERERELARARAVQASSLDASGPMKIRTEYTPKLGSKGNKALTTCTICGQQIPIDEIDEHMRIELLDPKWKSQRDVIEARRAQASELQLGANVVSSISEFAKARVDIFGDEEAEAKRKRAEEEDRLKRREREKIVWDGHTATKVGTMDKYSTNVNFEEQIAAIHKAKGLAPMDEAAAGPGIGPSIVPPPIDLSTAPPPRPAMAGPGTISSAPQPASMMGIPPVPLPTLHYQGMNATQTFGYQPPPAAAAPPMGMMPPRPGMPGAPPGMYGMPPPGGQMAGTIRSADEMNEGEESGEQLIKRQRVVKLPGGHLYPEQNWIDMHPHPISLQIQLPKDDTKPAWKLDGTIVTVSDLPLTTLVSTLRDRIVKRIESSAPQSRVRLACEGKELRNANTIASYNLEDGDLVTFIVKKK